MSLAESPTALLQRIASQNFKLEPISGESAFAAFRSAEAQGHIQQRYAALLQDPLVASLRRGGRPLPENLAELFAHSIQSDHFLHVSGTAPDGGDGNLVFASFELEAGSGQVAFADFFVNPASPDETHTMISLTNNFYRPGYSHAPAVVHNGEHMFNVSIAQLPRDASGKPYSYGNVVWFHYWWYDSHHHPWWWYGAYWWWWWRYQWFGYRWPWWYDYAFVWWHWLHWWGWSTWWGDLIPWGLTCQPPPPNQPGGNTPQG